MLKNYTLTAFSLKVYGVGEHAYKLFLDNAGGKLGAFIAMLP